MGWHTTRMLALCAWVLASAAVQAGARAATAPAIAENPPSDQGQVVLNVKSYGAVGDGHANDTAPIQRALRAAGGYPLSAGTVQVLFPAPGTYLTGSIFIPERGGIELRVEGTILGSTWWDDYPWMLASSPARGTKRAGLINGVGVCAEAEDANGKRYTGSFGPSFTQGPLETPSGSPLGCVRWQRVSNVALTGGGTIDGQGYAWWYNPAPNNHRSEMIRPVAVDGLRIFGLRMQNSPSWTHRIIQCTNVHARGITVEAGIDTDASEYNGHNVDGFDPDSSSDVLLEDSTIRAGDDCIAIYSMSGPTRNITVRNVTCYTPLTVTHGMSTQDVLFEGNRVLGGWGAKGHYKPRWWKTAMRVKSDRHTNITMKNIVYRDIVAEDVDLAINVELSYACQNASASMHDYQLCRESWTPVPGVRPKVSGVRWEDIVVRRGWRAAWISCLPEAPCRDLEITNLTVTPPEGETQAGGWVCDDASGVASRASPPPTNASCPGIHP